VFVINRRADALDALCGFAIITMILSGSIPFSGTAALPGWMYHSQLPPPDHVFNPNLPRITWVDLVFPFFLFAMGSAFPFALRKRIEQGIPYWKLSIHAIQRGFLLVVFALFL
jgi:predicted acyltransferase